MMPIRIEQVGLQQAIGRLDALIDAIQRKRYLHELGRLGLEYLRSQAPVITGEFRSSLTYVVDGDSVRWVSRGEPAKWADFIFRRHRLNRKMRAWVRVNGAPIIRRAIRSAIGG